MPIRNPVGVLGTMATQAADNVNITGGSANGMTLGATTPAPAAVTTANVTDTTDATSTTAAPLKSVGGLAVAKKAYFGDRTNVQGLVQVLCGDFRHADGDDAKTIDITAGAGVLEIITSQHSTGGQYLHAQYAFSVNSGSAAISEIFKLHTPHKYESVVWDVTVSVDAENDKIVVTFPTPNSSGTKYVYFNGLHLPTITGEITFTP